MAILLLLAASLLPGQTLVLDNARIWTANPEQPWAEAVRIEGRRIVEVGEKVNLAGARRFDVQGRLVIPGLHDAHIHFLSGSLGLSAIDLTGVCTLEGMQQAVAAYAREHPEKDWITGRGWEYFCFPNQRLPRKQDLDAVVKDRPVFLIAYDGHTAWANSKALERADINAATRFEGYGEIVKDPATGQPTGCLKEGAQSLIRRLLPRPSREDKLNAIREGMRLAASLGLTSIQNAGGDAEELSLYQELERKGELTLRVSQAFSVAPGRRPAFERQQSALVKTGAVKLMVDGVIESYTAAMLEPYTTNPSTSGSPAWTIAELNQTVAALDRDKWQIYTHAIGDRGVRLTLDAYEQARKINGRRDSRHRIEHIEVLNPADAPRFAALGVLASMQPIHADPDGVHLWSEAIGPKRVQFGFPWRTLERAGAALVFSSDWPASISVNPIRGLHNAVNRRTVTGKPEQGWTPHQRVSLETALKAYTSAAAFASFDEGRTGMIKPGMAADLVVLSQDVFKIEPMKIHETRVEWTMFDGRIIYQREPQ